MLLSKKIVFVIVMEMDKLNIVEAIVGRWRFYHKHKSIRRACRSAPVLSRVR
jgi:hypothetical protein